MAKAEAEKNHKAEAEAEKTATQYVMELVFFCPQGPVRSPNGFCLITQMATGILQKSQNLLQVLSVSHGRGREKSSNSNPIGDLTGPLFAQRGQLDHLMVFASSPKSYYKSNLLPHSCIHSSDVGNLPKKLQTTAESEAVRRFVRR